MTDINPENAREALAHANAARRSAATANNMPLAGLLLSTGAVFTTAVLADMSSNQLGDFQLGYFLVAIALAIPGVILYATARSWARSDSAILLSVLGGQILGFLLAVIGMGVGGPLALGFVGAALTIVATCVGMAIVAKRGKQ